jgi:hypothetical protein
MGKFAIVTGSLAMLLGLWLMLRDWMRPPFGGMGVLALAAGLMCVVVGLNARRR